MEGEPRGNETLLVGLEAVEFAKAKTPRSAMYTATTYVNVGTEVTAANGFGIEERHCR